MAYSDIKDPSAHFTTTLWTGAGGSPRAITNDANSGNFQPDFVWTKGRNEAYEHQLYDSSRGAGTTKGLTSNDTSAEGTVSATYGYLSSFDSNGFTGTAGTSGQNAYFDTNAKTYVAWQWKANGGTTSSNTDGNTTTTVQANQDAGFSIVTYTGTGSSQTMGHGLGVTPNIVLTKNRSGTGRAWSFNGNIGPLIYGTNKLTLNQTTALAADTNDITAASSTTFTGGGSNGTNANTVTYVAYCFAEKQGYSKFGSYVGNGNANGAFVYTGFKPAFLIMKRTDSTGAWHIFDNKRLGYNINNNVLQADANAAELAGADYPFVDILSNGFKTRRPTYGPNVSGGTYIYMAFAENPFVAGGIPTTAR